RGGKVPDLNPGDTGYRLTAQTTLDKNTGGNYKDMYSEAKKALAEISKQHPNTPWALLARSDSSVAIGLKLTSGAVPRWVSSPLAHPRPARKRLGPALRHRGRLILDQVRHDVQREPRGGDQVVVGDPDRDLHVGAGAGEQDVVGEVRREPEVVG